MSRRIALFGGSFDPFHIGHFLVAQKVWDEFKPHRVVFLPCAQSPLKQHPPKGSDSMRLQCLRRGLRGCPWAEVSDWEIRQQGASYSIDTVLHWKDLYPGFGLDWILGSDQWAQIRHWRKYRDLGKLVRFLVFPRPHPPKPMAGLRMACVPARFDLSASEIRQRLKQGRAVKGMVLSEVEPIIRRSRSYRS